MRSVDRRARTVIALGATLAALAAAGCGRRSEAGAATPSGDRAAAGRAATTAPARGTRADDGASRTASDDAGAAGGGDATAHDDAEASAAEAAAAKAEGEAEAAAQIMADEFLGTFSPPLIGLGGAGGGGGAGGNARAGGNGPSFPLPQQPPPPQAQRTNPYGGIANNTLPGTGTGTGTTGSPNNGNGPLGMQTPTLAPSPLPVNTRGEFIVPFTKAKVAKPFEADPSLNGMLLTGAFTGPSGVRWNVPGFWDGTQWKIRFAPDSPGQWSYDLFAQTAAGQDRVTGSFTAIAATHPPFLTIERHRLRGRDGSWFRGRGYNSGYQSPETIAFETLLARDVDIVSFWLQVPASFAKSGLAPLEGGGIGTYDQNVAAKLDAYVNDAEAAGMRLLPSLWPHDLLRDVDHPWGNPHWGENPYHTITDAVGFFALTDSAGKDTPQWHAQKNLYRYIMARWGTSPAIIGWVAVVEANGTTADAPGSAQPPAELEAWTVALRELFMTLDPRRTDGGAYPITVSLSNGEFDTQPPLDLLGVDSYEGQDSNLAVAAAIAGYGKRFSVTDQRWGLITEFGARAPKQPGAGDPSQPRHLHDGTWAAVGTGATVEPLLWSDGGKFPFPNDAMLREWTRVAAFDALLVKNGFDGADLTAAQSVDGNGAMVVTAANADRGQGWILGETISAGPPPTTSARVLATDDVVVLPAMAQGTFDVTWFDTATGSTLTSTATPAGDGTLTLPVPAGLAGKDDAAVFVVRQGAPTGNG